MQSSLYYFYPSDLPGWGLGLALEEGGINLFKHFESRVDSNGCFAYYEIKRTPLLNVRKAHLNNNGDK